MSLAVFDQSALDAIIEDRAVQHAMLAAFTRQLPLMMASLVASAGDDSGAAWRAAIHKLRGACLNIGAIRLSEGLEELESNSLEAAPAARAEGLRWIKAETKLLQAALPSCN